MNKKLLRDRCIRKRLKFRNIVLAAKFTLRSPILLVPQQARWCPAQLSCRGKNPIFFIEGVIIGICK